MGPLTVAVRDGDGKHRPGRLREGDDDQQSSDDCDPQVALAALEDDYGKQILMDTDESRTVNELADRIDMPLSTAYRKVKRLADAGLLRETTRVSSSGSHPAQYERVLEGISVSIDDGFEIECSQASTA